MMSAETVNEISLEEALAILPEEIANYVKSLPPEEAAKVVAQLLLKSDIEIRPLQEKDLQAIRERTTESCEFGFKKVDVDLSWQELSRPNYIALGSFAERDGQEVLAAFVVAELCRAPRGGEAGRPWREDDKVAGSSRSRDGGAPIRISAQELRAAMRAAGCRDPRDLAVAVWYIGVSYEFRRQGLGSELLDTVRQVGEQAGAASMWLHVAEYNPNAIAFYTRCGFTAAPDVFRPGDRGRHLLMHMPLTPAASPAVPPGGGGAEEDGEDEGLHACTSAVAEAAEEGRRGFGGSAGGGGGGGGGGSAKGKKKAGGGKKGGKRRALLVREEEVGPTGGAGAGALVSISGAGAAALLSGGGASTPWSARRVGGWLAGRATHVAASCAAGCVAVLPGARGFGGLRAPARGPGVAVARAVARVAATRQGLSTRQRTGPTGRGLSAMVV